MGTASVTDSVSVRASFPTLKAFESVKLDLLGEDVCDIRGCGLTETARANWQEPPRRCDANSMMSVLATRCFL